MDNKRIELIVKGLQQEDLITRINGAYELKHDILAKRIFQERVLHDRELELLYNRMVEARAEKSTLSEEALKYIRFRLPEMQGMFESKNLSSEQERQKWESYLEAELNEYENRKSINAKLRNRNKFLVAFLLFSTVLVCLLVYLSNDKHKLSEVMVSKFVNEFEYKEALNLQRDNELLWEGYTNDSCGYNTILYPTFYGTDIKQVGSDSVISVWDYFTNCIKCYHKNKNNQINWTYSHVIPDVASPPVFTRNGNFFASVLAKDRTDIKKSGGPNYIRICAMDNSHNGVDILDTIISSSIHIGLFSYKNNGDKVSIVYFQGDSLRITEYSRVKATLSNSSYWKDSTYLFAVIPNTGGFPITVTDSLLMVQDGSNVYLRKLNRIDDYMPRLESLYTLVMGDSVILCANIIDGDYYVKKYNTNNYESREWPDSTGIIPVGRFASPNEAMSNVIKKLNPLQGVQQTLKDIGKSISYKLDKENLKLLLWRNGGKDTIEISDSSKVINSFKIESQSAVVFYYEKDMYQKFVLYENLFSNKQSTHKIISKDLDYNGDLNKGMKNTIVTFKTKQSNNTSNFKYMGYLLDSHIFDISFVGEIYNAESDTNKIGNIRTINYYDKE